MKHILFICIIHITLFTYCHALNIDERKTDVYFANGVMTDRTAAYHNMNLIKENVRKDKYNGRDADMDKDLHFDIVYNTTLGMTKDYYETYS